MTRWCAVALCALGVLCAQDPAALLARATLIEEQEGDLDQAERAYRALLADQAAAAVQDAAALRLGALLWRLDRRDEARPLLDRAVAAGGDLAAKAAAVLQGQGDAERLERARAMVRRINTLANSKHGEEGNYDQQTTEALAVNENGLDWLGDAAVQAILEDLDSSTGHGNEAWSSDLTIPAEARLLRKLWQLGTPRAKTWLEQQVAQEPVQWLRFLARGSAGCAESLRPTLIRFLKVKDPTGEVWTAALKGLRSFPPEDLVRMANDEDTGVRCAAFDALRCDWYRFDDATTLAAVEASLRATLASHDPRCASAWQFVKRLGNTNTPHSRRLFLSLLPNVPEQFLSINPQPQPGIEDADLALALACLRSTSSSDVARSQAITNIVTQVLLGKPAWTAAGVHDWIALVNLELPPTARPMLDNALYQLAGYSAQVANDDDLPALLRTLPKVQWQGLDTLTARRLREDALPTWRELLGVAMAEAGGSDLLASYRQSRSPGQLRQSAGSLPVPDKLLQLLAMIGTDAAAAQLRPVAGQWPILTSRVAVWAICMSQCVDSQPARDLLRELLVLDLAEPDGLQPYERTQVLAELVRVGDVPAIPLLPQAFARGLAQTTALEFRSSKSGSFFTTDGLGLFMQPEANGRCGYPPEQLVLAWQQLAAHYPGPSLLGDLVSSTQHNPTPSSGTNAPLPGPRANRFEGQTVPLGALPVLTDVLLTHWSRLSDKQRHGLPPAFATFGQLPGDPTALSRDQRSMLDRLLAADDSDLALTVFGLLPSGLQPAFGEAACVALRRAPDKRWWSRLRQDGVAFDVATWRSLLGSYAEARPTIMLAIPRELATELRPELEGLLRDPEPGVRAAAGKALRSSLGYDAVPALLSLLRDETELGRKTAVELLDSLRQEREQQAYWVNAKHGIDTSPAGAAARLLAQAQPDQPKPQRLLAITSLGVLGEPTSLPYLIDLTRDADVEIATAARQAVQALHNRSRSGPK
ncbi:MAG: HEAT repeat domain-containing protein [Planctomycetes bacterium]|nr:HEAT repeat domain-containing protein [Planctomycetota bacterium]